MKKILASFFVLSLLWSVPALAFQDIFLVRHAEKVDESRDPALSHKGQRRALDLALHLRDAQIKNITTSEFQRTQKTAEPLAQLLQITAQVLPAKELEKWVAMIKTQQANALVVGHSNTVPDILKALGMSDVKPIADDEYDRLVIVHLHKDVAPSFSVLRY